MPRYTVVAKLMLSADTPGQAINKVGRLALGAGCSVASATVEPDLSLLKKHPASPSPAIGLSEVRLILSDEQV